MIRDLIWATLVNLKHKNYVLCFLIKDCQKWERWFNIGLGIASSASLALLISFDVFPKLWAVVITAGTIAAALKPYLPYMKRARTFNEKHYKAEHLNVEFEKLFYQLDMKHITETQAAERYYELKGQMIDIFQFDDETEIELTSKMEQKSRESVEASLKASYNLTF